ncbi:hypothetical protein [uncultured Eudoraea sp.]|uniref:hypothetical protein n=1 Tax=uncultured Eudoraea sp. TaxID=1035614 RepID=UPI0026164733|nr:hypothetical protein [uncultured Eudoraea sp.]
MELPYKEDIIITHYGCADFENEKHEIYWIGAIYFKDNVKEYYFADKDEIDVIKSFETLINANPSKTVVHWSMNSPKFGFKAITNRYLKLAEEGINIIPKNELDLSEYLKEKYGINYISRKGGRLNNLATLNGFSGYKDSNMVRDLNMGSDRLELLFSIVQAEWQGELKIDKLEARDYGTFDKNHFSEKGFRLYSFLHENYNYQFKTKYHNLYYFLKKDNPDSQLYRFNFTKKQYTEFVKTNFNVQLTTFKTSTYKYEDSERIKLQELANSYKEK